LAGYVLPASGDRPDSEQLQQYLGERLPEYMVPASLTVLDDLPRMPNGKVDRSSLPEPGGRAAAAEYVAPGDPLERVLANLWSDLLKVERVGLRDNFFQLGGHSLLVTQLVFRLREVFGVEVPLRTIFDKPTLGELSGLLTEDPTQKDRLIRKATEVLQ
jgi:acyl carrier protein